MQAEWTSQEGVHDVSRFLSDVLLPIHLTTDVTDVPGQLVPDGSC